MNEQAVYQISKGQSTPPLAIPINDSSVDFAPSPAETKSISDILAIAMPNVVKDGKYRGSHGFVSMRKRLDSSTSSRR